jgi:ABC-type glycerol-3-phosphate transport system substrate-binding protein
MSKCNLQRRRFAKSARTLLALGIGASIALGGATGQVAFAQQPVEIVYATFLDPNNQNDPRAAAQTRMVAAFEKANPNIKVRVQVDPTQQASLRALRSRSATPISSASRTFRCRNSSQPTAWSRWTTCSSATT